MYKKTVIDYLSIMHHIYYHFSQLLSIFIPVNRYLFTHTNNNGVDITKVDTVLFLKKISIQKGLFRMSLGLCIKNAGARL